MQSNEERQEREVEAVEMALAGLRQALAWAPIDSCSWRALAVLVPEFERRRRTLGGPSREGSRPTSRPL